MKLIFFTSYIFLFFIFAFPVQAHVLKTDNSVGAVIHIDPEDDPIAGEVSNIYFEFKDKNGDFKASECDCQFIVKKEGQEIFRTALFGAGDEPNLTSSAVSYTFPDKNIYQIEVSGKPTTGELFSPFTLRYDIRVERVKDTALTTNAPDESKEPTGFKLHWFHYLIITLGIGILLSIIFFSKGSHQR